MLSCLQQLVTLGAGEIRPSSGFYGHLLTFGTHALACMHAHTRTDTHTYTPYKLNNVFENDQMKSQIEATAI